MTVTVYRSTDAGAPNVLAGTIGTLITVLDACLVNGYGSKSPAGWSKPFSGTGLAAYLQGAKSGALQFYLRIDDSALAITAKMVGYESMTDISTGTNPFPTTGQMASGLFIPKSNTADGVVRPWMLVANERSFYLHVHHNETDLTASTSQKVSVFFGDITSYKAGDQYNCLIMGGTTSGSTSVNTGSINNASTGSLSGHYLARSYTQTGTSIAASKLIDYYRNGANNYIGGGGGTCAPYPDPISGGFLIAPILVTDGSASNCLVRGVLPGLWAPMHQLPASHYDTFTGQGSYAGKTFQLLDSNGAGNRCRFAVEISDTW